MVDIRPIVSRYDLWSPQIITTASGTNFGKGSIQIEQGWQLISIPVTYGYWDSTTHSLVHDDVTVAKFKNYVLDQIEDLYGVDNVEVANTYTGDQQAFYSYVVGSTPETSPHNFNLVYEDGANMEIAGFWLKSINPNNMLISWGE
jgi:hypothetical protein